MNKTNYFLFIPLPSALIPLPKLEHRSGFEPLSSTWQAEILNLTGLTMQETIRASVLSSTRRKFYLYLQKSEERFMRKSLNILVLSFLLIFPALAVSEVYAVPPPPVDLSVELQGPATAFVRSPYVYTVEVKNIGGANAAGVKVIVNLPLTDTSPTRHILGNLSGLQSGCQVIANKLECSLGTINKNKSKSFTFNFALPVSTKTLELKAVGSTTTPGETSLPNNTDTLTPALGYASNQITSANVLVSHCTGTGLTSYFECELFPSSISSFSMTLNPNWTITLPVSGYTTQWNQNSSPQQLNFTITETSTGEIVEFNGFATTNTCFEGMTTFSPNSGYVSPYKVCVQ
jgi:hypothetical protein